MFNGSVAYQVKAAKVNPARLNPSKTPAAVSYRRKKKDSEANALRAQQEAASVYADFVESFKAPDASAGIASTFVRGGIMGGSALEPSFSQPSLGFAPSSSSSTPSTSFSAPKFVKAGSSLATLPPSPSKSTMELQTPPAKRIKKSDMELFMEEMKREKQEQQTAPAAGSFEPPLLGMSMNQGQGIVITQGGLNTAGSGWVGGLPLLSPGQGGTPGMRINLQRGAGLLPFNTKPFPLSQQGSHYDGDTGTTNLYCGNLSPEMSEERLVREFGKFGDIASVKIMWPRSEDEKRRNRNCGFVSFMKRGGADDAMEKLAGTRVLDFDMKIGWGRAVKLPAIPLYRKNPHPNPETLCDPLPPVVNYPKENVMVAAEHIALPSAVAQLKIQAPVGHLRTIIDMTADYVAKLGHVFEKQIMIREAGNSEFHFMFQTFSQDHLYYRWKTYSLSQGDDIKQWRETPFQMMNGGAFWIPPSVNEVSSATEGTSGSRSERIPVTSDNKRTSDNKIRREKVDDKSRLSKSQEKELMSLLRSLTRDKTSIEEAMAFCLVNAEKSPEVVEIITDSLCVNETPLARKIARLFLVSDVLYNSSAPVRNASSYRTLFRDNLQVIFKGLGDKFASIEGRMTASAFRDKVTMVLHVWTAWSLFPSDFIDQLEVTFLGDTVEKEKREREILRTQESKKEREEDRKKTANATLVGLGGYGSGSEDDENDEDMDGLPFGGEQPLSLFGVASIVGDEEEDLDGEEMG